MHTIHTHTHTHTYCESYAESVTFKRDLLMAERDWKRVRERERSESTKMEGERFTEKERRDIERDEGRESEREGERSTMIK